MTDVCVIGQGNIGLPTALVIAASGCNVTGVDTNKSVVRNLNQGENGFVEPGLSELLASVLADKSYSASLDPIVADVYIVSVPTPLDSNNRVVLENVLDAAKTIAPLLTRDSIVILESTVPPGTTNGVFTDALNQYTQLIAGTDFLVAHCPERVLPGTILTELVENERVIGGTTPEASSKTSQFFKNFVRGEIHETDATTAELVKLSENIYRDVNIGLANELASAVQELGANIWDVVGLANMHPRVNIHQPGPGVGGYCIPVASWMISDNLNDESSLILSARDINARQPAKIVSTTLNILGDTPNPKVAVLGAAYKGGVGDARATPTLEIIEGLTRAGVSISVHDPLTTSFSHSLETLESALSQADIALLLTPHNQFRNIDSQTAAKLMKSRTVVDTRNILNVADWERSGFEVIQLGVGWR